MTSRIAICLALRLLRRRGCRLVARRRCRCSTSPPLVCGRLAIGCRWCLVDCLPDIRNCIRLGGCGQTSVRVCREYPRREFLECDACSVRIIRSMFGTELRIRPSRPRAGCDSSGGVTMSAAIATTGFSAQRDCQRRPSSGRPSRRVPRAAPSTDARGRVVFTTLAAAAARDRALVLVAQRWRAAGVARRRTSAARSSTSTVAPGDSLWAIAETIAPSADPRDVIADDHPAQPAESADVLAGQQLAIPAQYRRSDSAAAAWQSAALAGRAGLAMCTVTIARRPPHPRRPPRPDARTAPRRSRAASR